MFATGIDAGKTETKGVVRMTNADEIVNFSSGEGEEYDVQFVVWFVQVIAEIFIEKLIGEIAESGAKVLVSGGAIGELAMHYIEKHQMMVVKINRFGNFLFFNVLLIVLSVANLICVVFATLWELLLLFVSANRCPKSLARARPSDPKSLDPRKVFVVVVTV